MKKLGELIKELLQNGECVCPEEAKEREITAVVSDSRKMEKGCLFIAIRGANFDGHSAIGDAAKAGAAAVLAQEAEEEQKKACEEAGCALILTKDTRRALALVSAARYGHPAEKLRTVGITGTKGKSSISFLVKAALESLGIPCGLVGTVEVETGKAVYPAGNTTPESSALQAYMAEMVEAGCRAMVMEVSSQGLMLHRTDGIVFDVALFTNLSPDHIGENEHKDFDDYLHCKSLLFKQCRCAAVNGDDAHTEQILEGNTAERIVCFGFGEKAKYRAADLSLYQAGGHLGVRFLLHGITAEPKEVALPFPGRFSAQNILAALSAVYELLPRLGDERRPEETLDTVLKAFAGAVIKGRIEMLPVSREYTLMIDYAHNAMALESLLTTLREYGGGRIVTLFGCGGNRARSRRYEMGEVSGRLSDLSVITSDNPRNEEPLDIIADIVTGMKKTDGKYVTIADRKEAIRYCLENAEKGDIIVLAGKGHEDYQEIRGVKYPMDERRLVRDVLKELGKTESVQRMEQAYPFLAEN